MKTQRIFLLLTLLMLVFTLASCAGSTQAPDCFDFDEEAIFTDVTEYEGKYLDINTDYGLIALATTTLDSYGNFNRATKILDITDGNRVVYESFNTLSAESELAEPEIDLSNYPVIRVKQHVSSTEDVSGTVDVYNYYYYLIQNDEKAILLDQYNDTSRSEAFSVKKVNNVYVVEANDSVYWINRNFEVMREFPAVVSDTYTDAYFDIAAEYNNYLYTWETKITEPGAAIIIYDASGACCVKYTYTPGVAGTASGDSIIDPAVYVLNNGNVLVQECVTVEEGEAYDFEYGLVDPQKLNIVTKIINHKTGEVTEIDYNYLITKLESAYSRMEDDSNCFPFKLKDGYDNQAIVIPVLDGKLSNLREYIVTSNTLQTKYILPNAYLALIGEYDYIENISEKGYFAEAIIDGTEVYAQFDWAGNVVFKAPVNFVDIAGDFYYTDSAVYSMDGKVIFDTEGTIFANPIYENYGKTRQIIKIGDTIYLARVNYEKTPADQMDYYGGALEVYRLNKDGSTTMVSDGVETKVDLSDGIPCLAIVNFNNETASIYNTKNELALVIANEDLVESAFLGDALVVTIELDDGGYKTFVFGDKTVENDANN